MTTNRFVKSAFQFITSFGPAILISFVFSFIISLGLSPTYAQELSVDLHVKKSIMEDPANYFLSGLISVKVDDDFNMYLSDYSQRVVFKVDSSGNYIDTVVQSGKGPGEVNSIYSVMVDKAKDEIIIADRQNARISRLDLQGNELAAVKVNSSNNNIPVGMAEFTNGNYLLLFPVSSTQNLRVEKGVDTLFHVYNLESGERLQSIGDRGQILDSLGYSDGVAAKQTTLNIGSAKLINENQLLYAPSVYNGLILRYNRENDGNWYLSHSIRGDSMSRKEAINFDFDDYINNRQTYNDETNRFISTTMGSIGNAARLINYYSGGIYQTSDYVLHFYISADDYEDTFRHTLYVEIFDEDLNFLGSHPIYEGQVGELISGGITDMDSEGKFYMPIRHLSKPERNRALVFELEIN